VEKIEVIEPMKKYRARFQWALAPSKLVSRGRWIFWNWMSQRLWQLGISPGEEVDERSNKDDYEPEIRNRARQHTL
jgi:hypothetical protein